MKSLLVVCEYVSVNADGTFGLLRGGLNRLPVPAFPFSRSLGFLVRITGEFGEEGAHDFKLVVVDDKGQELTKASGHFHIQPEQRIINIGINMPVPLQRAGAINARLIIDRQFSADWPLDITLKGE